MNYCSAVLNNNIPAKGYEKDLELKNKLHEIRSALGIIQEENEDVFERKELYDAIGRLKKKRKKCYDFVTKAGPGFIEAVYQFFLRIGKEESIPTDWECTTLVQIFKGKGSPEKLENNRFVHTKLWITIKDY